MFKTCISIINIADAPEIVKKVIDETGWPISTIITKPDHVTIYFSYKWYQHHSVNTVKQAVKRFEERNKCYCKPNIYGDYFTEKTRHSTEQYKKALTEFARAAVIQGGFECGNVKDIMNKNSVTIGYKK